MTTQAIVRRPGRNFHEGLTTARLGRPDHGIMALQHEAYVNALRGLGLEVHVLEPLDAFPDGHFVEDTAVVLPEVAVLARPGALARRGEEEAMAPVLDRFRVMDRIQPPGTLDGGDVLLVERHLLIGLSQRTNEEGARQLGAVVGRYGYGSSTVPVGEGLHLKSGVNGLGGRRLLITSGFDRCEALAGYERLVVPQGEEYAANSLWINGTLIMPAGFPCTRRAVEALGLPIVELDMSEARKMDGGLTCLSLRL